MNKDLSKAPLSEEMVLKIRYVQVNNVELP